MYIRVALLAGALGLCHGAVVEQSPKHSSDDRPKHVEPHASEVPRNDHRPQRAPRVDRPSRNGSRDKHSDRKRESYRYGGDSGRGPLVGGHSHNHEHQYEGDKDLYHEGLQVTNSLCGIGGRKLRLAPCARSAEGHPGGQCREDRPHELRHYVVRCVLPGELARCGHTQCDRRVDVRPRYVPHSGDHGRQSESEGQRYGQRVVSGPSRRASKYRAYSNRCPAEDQDEGPYQLGYGRADDVGGVYLAAVEPTAARLFLLLLVDRPPRAPANTLFQTGLFFRADRAARDASPAHRGFTEGLVSRGGRLPRCRLPCREIFLPPPWASGWLAGEVTHRSGHRTGHIIEPCTLLTEPLATRPLPDVLGIYATAGLAVGVVVVDVRVDRMPRALAYCHAPSPPRSSFIENTTSSTLAQGIRTRRSRS